MWWFPLWCILCQPYCQSVNSFLIVIGITFFSLANMMFLQYGLVLRECAFRWKFSKIIFYIFVLNWIWEMRKCSKTDLRVMKVCQKLHLARVTQEKVRRFRKSQGFVYCIVQPWPSIHFSLVIYQVLQTLKVRKHREIRLYNTSKQVYCINKSNKMYTSSCS